MPVDPGIQAVLDTLNGEDGVDLSDMTVEEARAAIGMLAAIDGEPEPVAEVIDRTIPGPAGPIPVRVYTPSDSTGALLVWYHGGGWVIGDLDTSDPTARKLANRSGAIVVSVDYRLAPEHPFPAAVDDAWAALRRVADHGDEVGGDPSRLAVGGDSAGGNLAAIVAVLARDAGISALHHQLLVYPATDFSAVHPSREENGEGYLLTRRSMEWFEAHYLGPVAERGDLPKDGRVSPIHTPDLAGVAPATIMTGEYDPLRDEGRAYATALVEAGVPVDDQRYPTMIHGFISMGTVTPVTNQALDAAGANLPRRAGLIAVGRLDGTVSLVTGGASGIGAACASRFAAEGATVVTVDVAEGADRQVDVQDEEAVSAAVDAIVAEHGRLDSVVNAAGVAGGGPIHLLPIEEWRRVIDVNLTGTYLVAKHALRPMLEQRSGSIVNIASIEGIEGTEGGSSYNASKGGVVLLTKNLAIDYGRSGIRANCICPGFIETPMLSSVMDLPQLAEARETIREHHKLGRFGRPEEIASAALFLVSEDASFVTGHALVVDGGFTAGLRPGVLDAFGL